MKIAEFLKKLFPKPQLPQKRYAIIMIAIVYLFAKSYAVQEGDICHQQVVEELRSIALQMFADDDVQTYGERS